MPCPSRPPRPSDAGAWVRASCCWWSPAGTPSWRTRTPRPGCSATCPIHDAPRPIHEDRAEAAADALAGGPPTAHHERYLAGLDAERGRLDIKTMTLEGHEPLWSMGDDTPTAGRGRLDRPIADHLRQAFAQVTNPAIDPERERIVMDLRVELGRRPALLGGPPRGPRTLRLDRPIVADLGGLLGALRERRRKVRILDATWPVDAGAGGLASTLERLAGEAVAAAERGVEIVVSSHRAMSIDRPAVPSILAVGAIHTGLTAAGLRGRTDVVADAADILDVHAMAMVLAVGATAAHPRLAIELAAELAGTRGAEDISPAQAIERLVSAFEAGLRKTLARMGISSVASYIGGALIDTLDLAPDVVERCFPMAAAWPGRTTLGDLAERIIRRRAAAPRPAPDGARARAAAARSGVCPIPGRRGTAPVLAPHRDRDPGPVRGQARRSGRFCRTGALSNRSGPPRGGIVRAPR
ncbi:MAG: glutamate synthase central domain-containing protein [Candidatus Limnocylindrales bacterium]